MQCGTHGSRPSAVVCCHHVDAKERVVGFVENQSDPKDLQAWCELCEAAFLREGGMTDAFLAFNDFRVVCVDCYALIKARQSPTG